MIDSERLRELTRQLEANATDAERREMETWLADKRAAGDMALPEDWFAMKAQAILDKEQE